MTPDATVTAPNGQELPAKWVSVAQASAAMNLSEKTVLRRIKGGEIKAEKAALPAGGVAWRVRLDSAMDNGKDTERTIAPEPERTHFEREGRVMDNGKDSAPELSFPRAGTGKDNDRGELLAHLKSENLFLRGLVEQRDRDAAELRQSLKKALEIAPKALTSGTPETTPEPPISSDNRRSVIATGAAADEAGNDEVSSYSALADWLESQMGETK